MDSIKQTFTYFLLFWLCYNFAYSANPAPTSIVIPNEWELIKKGWPERDEKDKAYDRNPQFYYVEDKLQTLHWMIKRSFLDKFKDESQIFKLSFRYWSYKEVFKPQTGVLIDKEADPISDRYLANYYGFWMPCEYFLSYENLTKFQISINTGDDKTVVAFRDFKIESETQSETKKSFYESETLFDTTTDPTDGLVINGWNKYSEPPVITGNETKDYLYFSNNCNNGCFLKTESIKFSDFSDKDITKVELSFQYWSKSAKIYLSDKKSLDSSPTSWVPITETIDDKIYNKVSINITTEKKPLNEQSFVAVKDLKIKIYFTNKKEEFSCLKSGCDWKSDQLLQWSQNIPFLQQNAVYYYPNSEKNSLEITRNVDLSKINDCFSIKYLLAKDLKDAKINVNFNAKNESFKDTILTIKPKFYKSNQRFERTDFCLRDLLALTAKEYVISFSVKQNDYKDGINGLLLRFDDPKSQSQDWNFDEKVQTFLQPMKVPFEQQKGGELTQEWSNDWIQLSPQNQGLFEFKQNFIEFSALAESKSPASAQLISQWIKYDPNLHLVDPQYSVKVLNSDLFNAFIIRPKVCDWLSHCKPVMQNIIADKDNNKTFSFKFSPLKNTQYIKLLFYIEYFKPSYYDQDLEIRFDLKLLHFGDPCFEHQKPLICKNEGICVSDFKKDIPNKPSCSCPQAWTGETCDIQDHCGHKDNKTESGSKYCHEHNGMECENLESDFRCVCKPNQPNITWDSNTKACKPINEPKADKWTKSGSGSDYYPTSASNRLIYDFSNINTTKYDICFDLSYESNQTSQLNVGYYDTKDTQLFSVSLPAMGTPINFCVRDFRYTVRENFKISLQISDIPFNDPKIFLLKSFISSLNEIKTFPVNYISNWDKSEQSLSDPNTQYWKLIPNNLFTPTSNGNKSLTLNVNVSSKVQSKALLISDWINNNQNLSSSENYFQIQYTKDAFDRNFKLIIKIIYEEKEEIKTRVLSDGNKITKPIGNYTQSDYRLSIPSSMSGPFKLIFEITYYTNEKNASNLNITFRSVSIGDPCLTNKDNVCKNKGTCLGFGPKSYKCNCPEGYAGNNCEFINYCKNTTKENNIKFEEYCDYFPSLVNNKDNKCIVLSNNAFECRCAEKDYVWNSKLKRCVRNGFTRVVTSCEGKSCELFDSLLTDSKFSNKNIPPINELPFYFSAKNEAQLKIEIKNLDPLHDACFQFFYQIKDNSKLLISYNNQNPIELRPTHSHEWYPEKDAEEICVRSFSKDIDQNMNLTFVSKIFNPDNDIIAVRFVQNEVSVLNSFYPKDREPNLLSELPYLIHWSKSDNNISYSYKNQWPLALPKSEWTFGFDDSITFSAKNPFGEQTSYLMSNWLSKGIDGYKLRFNITDIDFKYFKLQIITYDSQMQQKFSSELILGDNNIYSNAQKPVVNQTVIIPITKMSTSFRVALKVDYNLNNDNLNDGNRRATFTLRSIDLGDPCVLDNAIDNTCSGAGTCVRNGPVTNYTCNCSKGHMDKNCQTTDYCNFANDKLSGLTGKQYCQQNAMGECSNGGYAGFFCKCDNNTFWNFETLKCENNFKCIAKECDSKSEYCKEPYDPKDDAICVCKDNYVNVSTTKLLKCVRFDRCDPIHRKLALLPAKPCGESTASCIALVDTEDDYNCVCKKGFQNSGEKQNSKCEPLFCKFPSLNSCQQTCLDNNTAARSYSCACTDFYDTNGDKCVLKKGNQCNCKGDAFCNSGSDDCVCKAGYRPVNDKDGKNIGCQPQLAFDVSDTVCPNGKVNVSKSDLICDCGTDYTLNSQKTCDLKPICGKGGEGRNDCDKRKALCIVRPEKEHNYECLCPTGKVFNENETLCVDYCSVDKRNETCDKLNADCDITKNLTAILLNNTKQYCVCRAGYVWSQNTKIKECVIGKYTEKFSLFIKNTFSSDAREDSTSAVKFAKNEKHLYRSKRNTELSKFNADLNGYYDDLKSMREENNKLNSEMRSRLEPIRFNQRLLFILKHIIDKTSYSDSKDTISVKSCELSSNFYNCEFTITLKNPLKEYNNLSEDLAKLCISYPGGNKNCFFPQMNANPNYYDSTQSLYSLVINKELLPKSSVIKFNPCQDLNDKNICPQYANCFDVKDSDLSLYSCRCNDKYFDEVSDQFIKIDGLTDDSKDRMKAIKYQCRVKESLCESCPKEHGKCHQSVPVEEKGEWIAPYYCSCEDEFVLTNNSKACVGVCVGINCNHGKCAKKGSTGYACDCEEGWNGINCDKEYKQPITLWIVAISVLAVLVVISAILAIVFAIKSRRADADDDSPHSSSHSMKEFSGTAYRVERNRTAVARQQSTTNGGQQNPTFHRD